MRIEYQSIDEANDEINRLMAEKAELRDTNRSLLAQLDEARAEIRRLESQDWEEDLDDATAEVTRQLVAMTKRKDGWRRVALMYRAELRHMDDYYDMNRGPWSRERREERQDVAQ